MRLRFELHPFAWFASGPSYGPLQKRSDAMTDTMAVVEIREWGFSERPVATNSRPSGASRH